jgi:isopenicillin N synthase-like dioxygenase
MNNLFRQSQLFFNSSNEVLDKVRRNEINSRGYADLEYTKQKIDAKHVFDMGHVPHPEFPDDHPSNHVLDGFNQWPQEEQFIPFVQAVKLYYQAVEKLAYTLLIVLVKGLSTNEPTARESEEYLLQNFRNHTSHMRLNYYPPYKSTYADVSSHTTTSTDNTNKIDSTIITNDLPTTNNMTNGGTNDAAVDVNTHLTNQIFGVSHHTDAGGLTILLQDSVAGLEAYTGGDLCLYQFAFER